MGKRTAHVQAPGYELCFTVVEHPCRIANELPDIVSGHSVHDNGPLSVGCVNSFCELFLLLCIDVETDGKFSVVPACNQI